MVWGSPPKEPYTLYQILYIYILLYNELGLEFTLGSLWVCTGWHTRHCCSSQLRVFSWAFSCILASKFHLPPPPPKHPEPGVPLHAGAYLEPCTAPSHGIWREVFGLHCIKGTWVCVGRTSVTRCTLRQGRSNSQLLNT